MENTMTNFEIKNQIEQYQAELQKSIAKNGNFILNEEVVLYKNKINDLRKICTHKNEENQFELFNGHCKYCGKKVNIK